jgi:hypothetical protein
MCTADAGDGADGEVEPAGGSLAGHDPITQRRLRHAVAF